MIALFSKRNMNQSCIVFAEPKSIIQKRDRIEFTTSYYWNPICHHISDLSASEQRVDHGHRGDGGHRYHGNLVLAS